MQVAVFGARGRMGTATCSAIEADPGLDLFQQIDLGDDLASVDGADVAVVFTTPDAALDAIRVSLSHGASVLVGTTGFDEAGLATVQELCDEHPDTAVLIVPNFAIGAVLMMRFAAEAAPYFASVEIIEEHHPNKVDAPSGTAVRTAEMIGEARRQRSMGQQQDATSAALDGARGADVSGVPVHSVRLSGRLAHQSVLFGNAGETLTIRHDSLDRNSFMPGVILALHAIGKLRGLHIGLDSVLTQID
jgi:4-hydroxy-tetrahydrodipicolinate reductase